MGLYIAVVLYVTVASDNYASVRMRKARYTVMCLCVCVCVSRVLQLLKDQWSASKSFYRLLAMFLDFNSKNNALFSSYG